MKLVFLSHPSFMTSLSMPRFATMLANGMKELGHDVEVWQPKAKFFNFTSKKILKKWLGYIDQYVIFPYNVKSQIKFYPNNTLFVLVDNALGPWVPLVADRPHVIHCHDFLAQFSALGKIPENPTRWSGKIYQSYIRRGYTKGRNFISVSEKTKKDLHNLLSTVPACSKVVYNGLNQSFFKIGLAEARKWFGLQIDVNLENGYILHVGGNQWYKNRQGVIEIYETWRSTYSLELPLILIGQPANIDLGNKRLASRFCDDIYLLTGISNKTLQLAYTGSSVFLFPSLAEGFGWPIAEAMALGCPVITTDEAPMTEVAGNAAFLISRRPNGKETVEKWAYDSAKVLEFVVNLSSEERTRVSEAGKLNAERFNSNNYILKVESIYQSILQDECNVE